MNLFTRYSCALTIVPHDNLIKHPSLQSFSPRASLVSPLSAKTVKGSIISSSSRTSLVSPLHAKIVKDSVISRAERETESRKNDVSTPVSFDEVDNDHFILGIPSETARPLALLFVAQFILFIGVGAVIPTIPLYGKAIGLSSSANGIVISAPALSLLLVARSGGKFADKARKPAMMWGMALIALSDLLTSMASSIIPLIIARIGLGAGRSVSESGERGMLCDYADLVPQFRGKILAAQQAILALGIAVGAPLGGYIVEMYGPRAAFLSVTAAACFALCVYYFLPETVETDRSDINNEDGDDIDWGQLIKDGSWQGLSLYEVGLKFGFAAKLASIPIIAASVLPGGAVGAGALLSAAGLSGLIGGPIGGFCSDRIGAKNTLILSGIMSGIGLVAIPVSLSTHSLDFIADGASFVIAVLIWSTAAAAQNPAVTAYSQELAPSGSEATAMALPRASGDFVYLFAPFLLGLVSDGALPMGSECAFAGIMGLLGVAALMIL